MNEPEFKAAAFALAEVTPKHLDRPTIPPISWRLEGDQLRVLLADGRTVRGLFPSPKRLACDGVACPFDQTGRQDG